jgi:four helix bundle protein
MKHKGSVLRERICRFVIAVRKYAEHIPTDYFHENLRRQLARSSTSIYLNFGEADAASSRKDFVHKLSLCHKELRESVHNLDLLCASDAAEIAFDAEKLRSEADEIGAMLFASIRTASKGLKE